MSNSRDSIFTTDTIFNSSTTIVQSKTGYRFTADALLLSWFIYNCSLNSKSESKSLEIGAGNGVISIVLKRRGYPAQIDSVEIQDTLYSLLKKNIEINNLSDSINSLQGDYISHNFNYEHYDTIFSNPPYFGIGDGRLNSHSEKAAARHEIFGDLPKFLNKSYKLLKNKGSFYIVYPSNRLQYALTAAEKNKFYLKDLLFVKEYESKDPSVFLAKFTKGSPNVKNSSVKQIVMKNSDNSYTDIGKEVMYDIP